jgi:hypothetical protein
MKSFQLKRLSLFFDILLFISIALQLLMDFNEDIALKLSPYEKTIHWSVLILLGIAMVLKIIVSRSSKR